MALEDIVLGEGDNEELILEIPLGSLNAPQDILTESSSNTGQLISELPNMEIFYPFVF